MRVMPQLQRRCGMPYSLSSNVNHSWKSLHLGGSYRLLQCTLEKGYLPYFNRVQQLVGTLKSMSCKVDDNEIVMAALDGFSSSLEHLIVAFDAPHIDDKLVIFDFVKNRLQEEERSKMRDGNQSRTLKVLTSFLGYLERVIIAQVCIPQLTV